jgi:hypothetical protein
MTTRQNQAPSVLVAYLDAAELAANWTAGDNGRYTLTAGGQPSIDTGVVIQPGNTVAVEGVGVMVWDGTYLAPALKKPDNGAVIPITGGTDHGGKATTISSAGLPGVPADHTVEAFLDAAELAGANWDTITADGWIPAASGNDPLQVDSHTITEGELVAVTGANRGVYKLNGRNLKPHAIPVEGQTYEVSSGTNHSGNTTVYDPAAGFPDPT